MGPLLQAELSTIVHIFGMLRQVNLKVRLKGILDGQASRDLLFSGWQRHSQLQVVRTISSLGYQPLRQPKTTLRGHTDFTRSIMFSPNGDTLVSANQDNTVRLWDAATGESKAILKGHRSSVGSAVFSPDGRTVASGGYDGIILLWDIPDKNAPTLSLLSFTIAVSGYWRTTYILFQHHKR